MLFKKILSILIIMMLLVSIVPVFAEDDIVIVLDPGHGGHDCGSSGKLNGQTFYERDLNDIVTAYLYDNLAEYNGVKVYLTRYDDTAMSLNMRGFTAGYLGADLFISLHMNAYENSYYGGAEIYVHSGNYLSEGAKTTTIIAKDILKRFEQYGFNNRGVKNRPIDDDEYYTYSNGAYADYYGIIRYATQLNVPAMIIEHGFMSNQSDLTFLSKSENLKKLADETAAAIADYYNLEKGSGQKMTLINQTEQLIIGDIPTTITVGDEIGNLTASGGSGSGKIHFETNDSDVIRIKGDKLIAVGAGKANITAVRDTDGVYQAKKSDNYIRITVNNPVTPSTPTPTQAPTSSPTQAPSSPTQAPTHEPTQMPTQTPTQAATQPAQTASVTASSTNSATEISSSSPKTPDNTDSTTDAFWTAVIICAGVLAAFLIISIILVLKGSKKNRS